MNVSQRKGLVVASQRLENILLDSIAGRGSCLSRKTYLADAADYALKTMLGRTPCKHDSVCG